MEAFLQIRRKIKTTAIAAIITVGAASVSFNIDDAMNITQAQWSVYDGMGMVVDINIDVDIYKNDHLILTFADNILLSDESNFVMVDAQTGVQRLNKIEERSIDIVFLDDYTADNVRIIMDDVFVDTRDIEIMQAVAVSIIRGPTALIARGVALPVQEVRTRVSASVPLAASVGVSTLAVRLDGLSPQVVREARQTYYIFSNNATGTRVQISADGSLRTDSGVDIDAVMDGNVTAGYEEYGITIENTRQVQVTQVFKNGDVALPLQETDVVLNPNITQKGSFDIVYKVAIDGETPAGSYRQRVFFTIIPSI